MLASKNPSTHKKVLVHGLRSFHVGKEKRHHVSWKGFICSWNISIWQTIGPLRYIQAYTCYNVCNVYVFGSAYVGLEWHNRVDHVVVHLSRHLRNLMTIANRLLNICWKYNPSQSHINDPKGLKYISEFYHCHKVYIYIWKWIESEIT